MLALVSMFDDVGGGLDVFLVVYSGRGCVWCFVWMSVFAGFDAAVVVVIFFFQVCHRCRRACDTGCLLEKEAIGVYVCV